MEEPNALVLEVLKQENKLVMSAFELKESAQTIKHYSELSISAEKINKLCEEIISILNRASKKGFPAADYAESLKKTAQVLWDHLLTRQIKDRLKTTIINELVLAIDEELINIPWELLYDGNDFICLRFNLGRLVRTKDEIVRAEYRSAADIPRMLILADPTADLKSAYQEGLNIKNQLDRRRKEISVDFKSTAIGTLYVKKNLSDYDIVHFAGHCEYGSDDPEDTGWVLSDGKFTAEDILALSESRSFPSLVFSNACHSAQVERESAPIDYKEKNYSLASAFLFSGVRHYVGSIWKVEDRLSLLFAAEFYSRLIKGHSVGESMRFGRLRLIKEYGLSGLSWASYLLYGNPNFRLFRRGAGHPPFKFKRNIHSYKKMAVKALIAALVIIPVISSYVFLPQVNPSNHLSYLRAQKSLAKGDNQQASDICSRIINNDPFYLSAYPLIADACQRQGKRDAALRYYFDYSLASEKKQNKKHLASSYTGIGWIYHQQGDYEKAFEFYSKAVSLSRESRDRLNEAVALRKLAVWHIDKKEQDKALELLIKSSEINRERQGIREHAHNLACDYFDMGLVFTNKNDFAAARELYHKSLSLFEKLKLKNELSDCFFNLGEICIFEKQYQKALDYYSRGVKIDETQGNKSNLASDYNMLGELYVEMDDPEKAETYFSRSIAISKQINARPELASASYNKGLLYKNKGQKNKAREYLRQAQEIYRSMDTSEYRKIQEELIKLDN
ncbi:MAG: CHAT domain-containing protein [Candidatus Omnitrophica bacterium]|nr:CHAT domain-containing protein [Candidatus Omnitrophota bacterium]MDD5553508.1 CHAT domain-containing protein [Candidatus Omnitrophota bacterium]